MTYNQKDYIIDAMNGFVMQKTTFPFVAIVMDDASMDGEQGVIERYVGENFWCSEESCKRWETEEANWLFAQHKENNNCFFVISLLKKNLYKQKWIKPELIKQWEKNSKYIAICEGDDYWTDPLKLQKQVDFMEAHEEYSMCFHKVEILSDEREKGLFSQLREGNYSARDIYNDWIVPTCSVLYRNGKPFETSSEVVYGDIFLWLQLAERGKLYCLGFVGAVYRRHSGSLSCGYSTATCVKLYHQYKFFEKRFPAFKDISRRKQEEQGLKGILYAPYFPGIWKYRFLYMFRHPELFFSSFFTTTILSYTPIRNYKIWKK